MSEKPFIALNFKVYAQTEGDGAAKLAKIAKEVADETGVRIVVAPPAIALSECAKIGIEVFAQHVHPNKAGAHTGTITSSALKAAGIDGSIVNHSEHRIPHEDVKKVVENLAEEGLQSMVCAQDPVESGQLSLFKPTYIAVEPPELIGSGISVSTAKPEIVTGAVQAVRENGNVPVLCGAGVSSGEDVKKAIELGAAGVLLASAYVKAQNPKEMLLEMARAI